MTWTPHDRDYVIGRLNVQIRRAAVSMMPPFLSESYHLCMSRRVIDACMHIRQACLTPEKPTLDKRSDPLLVSMALVFKRALLGGALTHHVPHSRLRRYMATGLQGYTSARIMVANHTSVTVPLNEIYRVDTGDHDNFAETNDVRIEGVPRCVQPRVTRPCKSDFDRGGRLSVCICAPGTATTTSVLLITDGLFMIATSCIVKS